MKKTILLIAILLLNISFAFSNPMIKCMKTYGVSVDKAYISSYSVLKNLKYNVAEIQSESGYILFNAGNREFLLETSSKGSETLIKIMPVDSDMSDLSVQENVFKTLDTEILKAK